MLAKKPKGATQKRGSSGVAGLVWMFVGAVLTLMIGFFLYLWNPLNMGVDPTAQERPTVQPINQASTEGGDYEFYDLLPEQEITSIPDAAITDANTDNPNSEAPVEFEPDVVVVIPRPQVQPRSDNVQGNNGINNDNAANSTTSNNSATATNNSDTAPNIAINNATSVDTIANPMQATNSPQTGTNDNNKVVVVEEEGTYDDPSSPVKNGSATSNPSTTNRNDKGNVPALQNGSNMAASAKNGSANIAASDVKKTYILQINSFSGSEAADKRRAQVLMAGVDARVVKRKMDNGQVFYQVVSNQMSNAQRVKMAQQKLQNNGIDSLIVEQQHP